MKRNTNSATRTTSTKSSTPPKKRGRPAKKIVASHKNGKWETGLITTSNKSVIEQEGWVNTTDLIKDQLLESKNNLIESLRKEMKAQDDAILKFKIDILDQAAIINYLEKKIDKLKGELANG